MHSPGWQWSAELETLSIKPGNLLNVNKRDRVLGIGTQRKKKGEAFHSSASQDGWFNKEQRYVCAYLISVIFRIISVLPAFSR